MWHDNIHAAIKSLHTTVAFPSDYTWISLDGGDPVMQYWNEAKLGPLDLAAIEAEALRLVALSLRVIEVSRAQALMALHNAALLETVEAMIANHPYKPVQIWYHNASHWHRNHPYLEGVALELNLADRQIDDLFAAASLLTR